MRSLLLSLALIPTTVGVAQHTMCLRNIAGIVEQKVDAAQLKCLATTIYGEARGESQQGQIAVGFTLLNRAKNKTLCQVALAPKQYSIFNNNPELRAAAVSMHLEPKQKNTIDNKSWAQSLMVAEMVMKRAIKDPTNGATHYIADKLMRSKGYSYPRWSRQFTVVAVIDNHRFFKEGKQS